MSAAQNPPLVMSHIKIASEPNILFVDGLAQSERGLDCIQSPCCAPRVSWPC